jgi:hypothetical protein
VDDAPAEPAGDAASGTPPPATSPRAEPAGETDSGVSAIELYEGRILLGPSVASGEYTGKVTAQIASYRSRTIADEVLLEASRRTNLKGVVLPAQVGETLWYRILIGSFADPEDLAEAISPLLRDNTVTEAVLRPVPAAWATRLEGTP